MLFYGENSKWINNKHELLKSAYEQLKTYNKNYFPIKNLNNNDISDINYKLWEDRGKIIENFKNSPSVATRNLKSEIRQERDYNEFAKYEDQLGCFMAQFFYLSNKDEKTKQKLIDKIFRNNSTLNSVISFKEDKQQLLAGKTYTYSGFKNIIKTKTQADIIYEKNKILVLQITDYDDLRIIGENSLWCFSYGQNNYKDFDKFSTNGIVYIIVNFNLPQDDTWFMLTLIKEIDWDSEYEEDESDTDNEDKLYDITNDMLDRPVVNLEKLFGLEKAKELFDFELKTF